MSVVELRHHFAREDLERGEQVDRSVPLVLVGPSLRESRSDGERGLLALESLDLRLLVDAEHDRFLRRVQVQSHDVGELLLEPRVVAELERLTPMGLEASGLPDPVHGHVTDAELAGQGSGGPVRLTGRGRVEGGVDNLPREGGRDRGVGSGSRSVLADSLDTEEGEALTPETDGVGASMELVGNLLVLTTLGRTEYDASSKDQSVRGGTAARPGLELAAFVGGENDWEGDPHALPFP